MEKVISKKHTAYLSLGSNIGDRFQNLQTALNNIQQKTGKITKVSSIYENPPIGFDAEEQFYNICLELKTDFNPNELLKILKEIEVEMGRKTLLNEAYSSRIIDIDIIFFDHLQVKNEHLSVPHKLFRNRKFVLQPLCEINNTIIDPVTKLTINQLNKNCSDKSLLIIVEKQFLVFD